MIWKVIEKFHGSSHHQPGSWIPKRPWDSAWRPRLPALVPLLEQPGARCHRASGVRSAQPDITRSITSSGWVFYIYIWLVVEPPL